MKDNSIFNKSAIVVAHPDDEILWFSSLLMDIEHVFICYLNEVANPDYGNKRRKALSSIANSNNILSKKISCLEVQAIGASRPRSFVSPNFCGFGIEMKNKKGIDKYNAKYKENYAELYDKLDTALSGFKNVITHNPWGEYGHVEHVQVYRAVQNLQKSHGYDIWYSNYCSTLTAELATSIFNSSKFQTFQTNSILACEIMDIYKESDCWTWHDNWKWPNEETFHRSMGQEMTSVNRDTTRTINLIYTDPIENVQKNATKFNLKKIQKKLKL